MSDARTALGAAVDELEAITARLAEPGLEGDALAELAEAAMRVSGRVSELLPQVIREIERAAEGTADDAPA